MGIVEQESGLAALGVSRVPEQSWSEGKGLCEEAHTMTHVPRVSRPFPKDLFQELA